jgi:N-acetylglutamate synthase-like GNAT family acetyltransferase
MEIIFEEALAADKEKVTALLKEINLWDEDVVPVCTFIAKADGEMAGIVNLLEVDEFIELTHLGVLPEYRKLGVGKQLVQYFCAEAKKKYADRESVLVYLNTVIPEYFLKLGFKVTDKFPKQYKKSVHWCIGCEPAKCISMVLEV